MIFIMKEYLKTAIVLDAFGVGMDELDRLKQIYVLDDDVQKYNEAMKHPEFVKLDNLSKVGMLKAWQDSYGNKFYGKNQYELLCLEMKEKAYTLLEEICSNDNVSLEKWFDVKDNPLVSLIQGMLYYYGFLGFDDADYGKRLIKEASTYNNATALLWCLHHASGQAEREELYRRLSTLSDMRCYPKELKAVAEKYDLTCSTIRKSKNLIGFV